MASIWKRRRRRRADIELDYLDWMGQKTDKQVEEPDNILKGSVGL
jgi:hypothetical protein